MTVDLFIRGATLTFKLTLYKRSCRFECIWAYRKDEEMEFFSLVLYRYISYIHVCITLVPVYSGKQILSGDFTIFSAKRSFLLRKRMMDVSAKNLLLHIESKSVRDSCIRFCREERDNIESNTFGFFNLHNYREHFNSASLLNLYYIHL